MKITKKKKKKRKKKSRWRTLSRYVALGTSLVVIGNDCTDSC